MTQELEDQILDTVINSWDNQLLENVSEKFPATQVKKNPRGFDYVDIPSVINRLNEVAGLAWSSRLVETKCQVLSPERDGIGVTRKGTQVAGFHYNVAIELTIAGSTRVGVGSDFDTDPDKAYKTAYAEAIKKAGHQFGIALYLWDAEERADVAQAQQAAAGNVAALKNQVVKLAKKYDAGTTPADIAKFFKIKVDELQDATVLTKILKEHKVID